MHHISKTQKSHSDAQAEVMVAELKKLKDSVADIKDNQRILNANLEVLNNKLDIVIDLLKKGIFIF